MKKLHISLSIFLFIACLCLPGCSTKQKYEKAIWNTTEYKGVSAIVTDITPSGLSAALDNGTEHDFYITGWAHIQTRIDNEWYIVPPVKDFPSVPETSDAVSDHQVTEPFVIDWSEHYGQLPAGEYRIGIMFDGNVDVRTTLSTWGYFSLS